MNPPALKLKHQSLPFQVLSLHSSELTSLSEELLAKAAAVPDFFKDMPVVIDVAGLEEQVLCELDILAFADLLGSVGIVPVGVQNWPKHRTLPKPLVPLRAVAVKESVTTPGTAQLQMPSETLVLEKPLRTGQRIYHPSGDVVLLSKTSAGSEILAGGSIHAYATARGRLLAGVHGQIKARIYCQELRAELVSIAGNFKLFDSPVTFAEGPQMIRLDEEQLHILPL